MNSMGYEVGFKDGALSGYKLAISDLLPLIQKYKSTMEPNEFEVLVDSLQLPHSIKSKIMGISE